MAATSQNAVRPPVPFAGEGGCARRVRRPREAHGGHGVVGMRAPIEGACRQLGAPLPPGICRALQTSDDASQERVPGFAASSKPGVRLRQQRAQGAQAQDHLCAVRARWSMAPGPANRGPMGRKEG